MCVLVVDSSRVMRQIVIRTLRQAGFGGFDVVEAGDGRGAWDLVGQVRPELVISGWKLNGLGGLALLRALRRAGNEVPFGFVTSERSWVSRERAVGAGASFLVTKPFTVDSFESAVGSVLGGGGEVRPWAGGDVREAVLDGSGEVPVVPPRMVVRETMAALLGRDVHVHDGDLRVVPGGGQHVTVGSVVDERGELQAVLIADLGLSAVLGASLGLLAATQVQEMVRAGVLTDEVADNAREVLNVLAATLNGAGVRAVRLGGFWPGVEPVPLGVALAARSVARREDLLVTVAGYGTGNLSIVMTVA